MGDFNQQFGITRNDTGEKIKKLPTFPGTIPEESTTPTATAPAAAPMAGDPSAVFLAPTSPAQEMNPIKRQMIAETTAKAAAAPAVDAPITSDANEELVQAGEIAAATRARAVERYQVDLPDEVYNVIRDRIANAPDPDAEGYRWATAWRYTQMYDISMEEAYANLEYYNKALYGDVRFTPKDNFAAVSDAFALGVNTVKRNSIGVSLASAIDDGNEIEQRRLEKMLVEVNADNASLADNQPRSWYVEALKFGAQSAPFTGMVALAGITGGALAPAAATAAAFAVSMNQAAGGEYLDMREDGVSHDTARALSLVSGSLQAVVEIALGNTASLITKGTGAQTITANLFKRMNVTKSWTRAARVLGEYIGETGEEGLEEALQSLISSGANNLAAELEGAGVDRVTAEEAARDAWESWKGGVLGSLVLGAAGAGINAHTEIKDALALKEAARTIDSKEAFIASTGDSKAFEGLSDADRVATQEKIWTAAAKQRDARVSEEAAAIAETGDFTGEAPLVDGETDTVAPRGATQRTAEGKLYVQEGSTVTQNDDGSATRVLKVGNPNEETSFNRYGYIKYREYDDRVVVDDFRMSPGREDIRAEFFDEFSSRVAGKSIDWEPTNAQGRKLKETIIAGNPAGSKAGLQYYAADLDPGTVRGRVKLDAQIKKYLPRLNDAERTAAVALLETRAGVRGVDLDSYLASTFQDGIFSDANVLPEAAQSTGMDGSRVKGGVSFAADDIGGNAKALVYVTEKSDFSTYTHEIAHVFRRELAGDQLAEAERAFGVTDGAWTRDAEEKFAVGFEEYLREGTAPTTVLEDLYRKMAEFLHKIYNALAARVEVSPDIRKVYDELLAGAGPLAEVAAASKQTTATTARAAESSTTTSGMLTDTRNETGPERDEAWQDEALELDDEQGDQTVADASKALLASAGEAYKTIPEDMFFQDERVKKLLEHMTKDELIKMLHSSDSAAGIANYRAYRRDIEDEGAWPVQVSLDADSLKWVNDNMGHSSGDMMLREIGEKLASASKDGSVRVYHKSGDEFLVQAKTVNEYLKFKIELDNLLEKVIIRVRDDAIGGTIVKPGIFLSDGIDNKGDMDAADKNLEPEKSYREHHGERAGRGKVPPGVRIDYDTGRSIDGHAAQSFFNHREKELKKLLKREKQNSKPVNQFTPERTRELRKIIEDGGEILFQSVYHGTPHEFERFDISKIGTGEGSQAYGWGLYFADNQDVAEWYQKKLSRKSYLSLTDEIEAIKIDGKSIKENIQFENLPGLLSRDFVEAVKQKDRLEVLSALYNEAEKWDRLANDETYPYRDYAVAAQKALSDLQKKIEDGAKIEFPQGHIYQAEIPENDTYLDWDKPLHAQSDYVRERLERLVNEDTRLSPSRGMFIYDGSIKGEVFYSEIARSIYHDDKVTSLKLKDLGISGIKYRNQIARTNTNEEQYNYVVFDDQDITNTTMLFQTETVELENETGSLMVMHNTSADSLVKSVQANGMPMPSIAIMRPEQGFTQFGGISLIGPKDIIDPEQNDSNRVYNRDVWSPTVPEPEYTIKKKKLDALDALFTAAKKYAYNGIGFENVNATDYNTPERMARYFARSANVKAAYLIEKGIEIPDFFQTPFIAEGIEWANTPEVIAAVTAKPAKMPTIEEVENPDYDPTKPEEKYWNRKTLFNIYKPDGELYTQERTIEEAQRDADNLTNPRDDPELSKAIDKAVWDAYISNNTKGMTEEDRKDFIGNGPADHPRWFDDDGSVSFSKYDKIERAVYQTQRGVKLRDTTETRAWIDERASQEDVEAWLREKAKGIYSDPFLKINGEKVPYTAETMVRKMKAQGDIGAQEGFAGIQNLGKIAAMAANKLESIAEIRSEGESLQSADEVKKYEDETLHELDETYLNIAAAGYKYKNADLFTVRTDARQALFNYVSQMGFDIDRTVLARKLRSLDFSGDAVVDAAVDLINALKDAPIDYIEAKPKRVVSIAEFSIAVIPEDTDPAVRAMIEGQGLNVYTYESNSQDDRLEVVRKVALENPDILFQTEEELVRDAATFDSWQEFMEYYEEDSWTRPEDAAVPENADAQWYQTVWEKAHGIVTEESLNEQEVAERATADQRAPGSPDTQDALWLTEMQAKPEALDEFLKRINDIMTYKDQFGPADQGELDSRENVERLKRRIITEMRHGSWISNATRVSAGRALTDRARRQLISLMRGAVRDYRSLYADIMEDDEWSVALADTTAGKLAKIADPSVDYTEITPERRRKIAERIENAEIAKKLKSGDLTMEEAERHIAFLKDELKGAASRETALEKELQEEKDETSADYRRLSDWQTRQLLKLKDELDVARAKHESRSDKTSRMIERGQAITKKYALETQQFKANYDTIFRKFSDLSRTMEISGAVKTALARRESLYEARMENARLRDQISAAREARKIRTGLVKHVMRRVSFDRVNYNEARKILAIQRKFFPALEKGVNKWIGTEGPYLREFYSQWKTSDEFREEFVATAEKGGMSRKKLNRALKLLEKDYDAWTRSEREELLAVLPKEYPFEELNLAALEKEREESLQLDETSDEFDTIIREALPSRIAARIESRPFAEWTIEEMEELAGVVDGLYTAGKRMREAKKVAQQTEAERIRGRIIEAVKDAGFESDDTPEERKRKKEKLDRTLTGTRHVQGTLAADAARESFRNRILKNGYADANVRRVARILDGGRDGVNVGLLYDQEDVAFNEKHRRIRERSRKIAKAMETSQVTAEDLYRKVDIANFWGPGAAESFTVDDLLFVLKADEDEQSKRAVMFGNFLTDTERQQPGANQFNAMEEYLASIADPRYQAALAAARALPENVRQFADAISADYGDQYERMNEASIAEFNAPVWRVEHYVPLMRRDSSGDTNENRVRDDLLNLGGGRNQTGADKGMTQKRIDIAAMYQRPVQMGLYSTWADSVKRTEHFIAYAPYVRELNRVYKNVQSSEVRGWIKARYGDKMTKYIDDYINECANPDAAAKQSELDRIIRGLRGRTAPAYLAWKVSGVLKQFVTSPAPYLQFVSPAEYASAAFDLARNYSTLSDAIREKSVFMDSRVMDPLFDLVREQQDKAKNELAAGWMKITDTGMKGLEFADWSCVAPGWLAVYRKTLAAARKDNQGAYEREVARLEEKNRTGLVEEMRTADEIRAIAEGKVKDEADLEALAIKAADDATRMCQPSSRVTDLAPMFKSREANSEALKVLTQFQTSLNVIWQNIRYDLPAAVRAKEYRKVVGIVAGYVAAGAAVNLMTGGAGDDDDDALSKAKRFAYYSTTQFTDAVPIIGDMVTRLAEKTITGDSGAVFSDDVFPAASKLFQSAEALTAGDWDRTLTRFGEGVGYALGAPVSGVKEIIRATDDPAALIGRR